MKCVFTWQPETFLQQYFKKKINDAIELVFVDKKDLEGIKKAAKNADALAGWVINKDILNNTLKLKYMFYPGAGVQHYDEDLINLIQSKNIIFTNSHSNSFATAQHACALLLNLCNKILLHHSFLKDGNWRTGDLEGKSISLRGKQIGLLGFGAIGQYIYNMLKGFDCTFSAFKKRHSLSNEFANAVALFSNERNGLHDFLKQLDILICSLPQTSSTIDLINASNINFLKKDALVVNIGRGPVIEEKALFDALNNKEIAGAAIDVWYNYKPIADEDGNKFPFNYPFSTLENVILSPHRGASPMDDPFRFEELVYNINELVKPNPQPINVIDFDKGY